MNTDAAYQILWKTGGTRGEVCDAFRAIYDACHGDIIKQAQSGRWIDVNSLAPWSLWMTPIEANLWEAVRNGRFPLYPQYPVGNRLVDFGNPYHKVAVEADSFAHHNPINDRARDSELAALGWSTYRVSSRFLKADPVPPDTAVMDDVEADAALRDFMLGTPEGLMEALHVFHIAKPDQHGDPQYERARQALNRWQGRTIIDG